MSRATGNHLLAGVFFPRQSGRLRATSCVLEAGKSRRHRKRRVRRGTSVFCRLYDCVSSGELHSAKRDLLYSSLMGIITEEAVKARRRHDKAFSSCINTCTAALFVYTGNISWHDCIRYCFCYYYSLCVWRALWVLVCVEVTVHVCMCV